MERLHSRPVAGEKYSLIVKVSVDVNLASFSQGLSDGGHEISTLIKLNINTQSNKNEFQCRHRIDTNIISYHIQNCRTSSKQA